MIFAIWQNENNGWLENRAFIINSSSGKKYIYIWCSVPIDSCIFNCINCVQLSVYYNKRQKAKQERGKKKKQQKSDSNRNDKRTTAPHTIRFVDMYITETLKTTQKKNRPDIYGNSFLWLKSMYLGRFWLSEHIQRIEISRMSRNFECWFRGVRREFHSFCINLNNVMKMSYNFFSTGTQHMLVAQRCIQLLYIYFVFTYSASFSCHMQIYIYV